MTKSIKSNTPQLRINAANIAASWQGRTGFNQKSVPAEMLQERDRILAEHRRRIEGTIDYHMSRALGCLVLDADLELVALDFDNVMENGTPANGESA